MIQITKSHFLLSGFFLSFLIFVNLASAIPITGCMEISEPGTYELTGNITLNYDGGSSYQCIVILSSDVILNGNGYTLNNIGSNSMQGVTVGLGAFYTPHYVQVKNLRFRNTVLHVADSSHSVYSNLSFQDGIISLQTALPQSVSNQRATNNTFQHFSISSTSFPGYGGHIIVAGLARTDFPAVNNRFTNFRITSNFDSPPTILIRGSQFYNTSFENFVLLQNYSGSMSAPKSFIHVGDYYQAVNDLYNVKFINGTISSRVPSYLGSPIKVTSPMISNSDGQLYSHVEGATFDVRFNVSLGSSYRHYSFEPFSFEGLYSELTGMSFINQGASSYSSLSGAFAYAVTGQGKVESLFEISPQNPISGNRLDSLYSISSNNITIRSSAPSVINDRHRLTIYGLSGYSNPEVRRGGIPCDYQQGCIMESFSGGTAVFTVPGFGVYSIANEEGGNNPSPWDYNRDGFVNVPDIFAFLSDWFSHCDSC